MRVGLVCPIRQGQEYIRDYVEYHLNLGFDKIILIDNNETDGPNPMTVLSEFTDYIEYVDKRGDHSPTRQNDNNTEVYQKYWTEFDWLFFSDDDEYYVLNIDSDIKEFLSNRHFNKVDVIGINWKLMTDNNLVYYENIPVFERFTEAAAINLRLKYQNITENSHIKSAVRCSRPDIRFNHPHFPVADTTLVSVNGSGSHIPSRSPFCASDYKYIELRHFMYKTAEEFCKNRIGTQRYYQNAKYDGVPVDNAHEIENFFRLNKWTQEKQDVIDKYCREHNII